MQSKEIKIRNYILEHTSSYKDDLIKRLQDSEFARVYLETAFEFYQADKDVEALLLAMRDVAEAQGGIGELAKRTTISRQHLYDILASKHKPRLDNWLEILSALGFRVRLESMSVLETTTSHHNG